MGDSLDERHRKVSALLSEAAKTHHQVYRISDGADDDWASWYADWLVNLSEFQDILGVPVVRSELTYMLVLLDREQGDREQGDREQGDREQGDREQGDPGHEERWQEYYARELLRHFDRSQK